MAGSGCLPILPAVNPRVLLMALTYINRLHDEMLFGLFRAMRKGNFLLVGRRGDGKTAALMRFSDRLIDSGAEFSSEFPVSLKEFTFVPPFAKINLIDDVDLQPSTELIKAIERSRAAALNIMTSEPVSVDRLRDVIAFDGVVEIGALSIKDQSILISEWQKANGIDKGITKARRVLDDYVEREKSQSARTGNTSEQFAAR